ncbi:MAG: undecaprenyl-phosphate glucose phosphotransferase [Gammaproteobacteria bacterium]|nr:undecaprenyl-phosphate glucose phosphotransferase [Gammaproteobacteria bacterium]
MVSSTNTNPELRDGTLTHEAYLSSSIVVGLTALAEALTAIGLGLLIHALYVVDEPEKVTQYYAAMGIFALLMLQAFHTLGLYRFGRILTPYQQIAKIVGVCLLLFLLMTTGAFALKISEDYSRVWAFAWLGSAMVGLIAVRFAAAAAVRELAAARKLGRNIVIYGGSDQGRRLIQHIEGLHEPWNRIVAVFDDRAERTGPFVRGHRILGGVDAMVNWCRVHRVDEVLIALPAVAQDRVLMLVRSLGALPINMRLSPEFSSYDLLLRRTTNQYNVPMLSLLEKPVTGWGAISKRILDLTVASAVATVGAPFLALVAAWIKLDSPGPVFFRQPRYGFNHQVIDVLKFRTMYVDQTDTNADTLTRKDDPRVTRVGAFLRRFSIDEVPQIFNVLSGSMSIVGPRPHAMHAKAGNVLYEDVIDQYAVRHKVKPGITGWAQVNGWRGETRDEAALLGRLEHDLYYIDNWSLPFDVSIMFRTVFAVMRGENSY